MKNEKHELFSEDCENFLIHEMCICIEDLKSKILTDAPDDIPLFQDLVTLFQTIFFSTDRKNSDYINKSVFELFDKHKVAIDESIEYLIGDNLRHIFINFYTGGILEVFQHRQAEMWYPKIILRENIGLRDDINCLSDEIEIYRGMSKAEFIGKKFGQAWTLDQNIAREFAFDHYKDSVSYQGTRRCVVKAKIQREYIYHYKKSAREEEVIIDERMIIAEFLEVIDERTTEEGNKN